MAYRPTQLQRYDLYLENVFLNFHMGLGPICSTGQSLISSCQVTRAFILISSNSVKLKQDYTEFFKRTIQKPSSKDTAKTSSVQFKCMITYYSFLVIVLR